jgi:hypothetical protein
MSCVSTKSTAEAFNALKNIQYEKIFQLYPHPCLIIRKINHKIVSVNETFEKEVMPAASAINLSFFEDLFDFESRSRCSELLMAEDKKFMRFLGRISVLLGEEKCKYRGQSFM